MPIELIERSSDGRHIGWLGLGHRKSRHPCTAAPAALPFAALTLFLRFGAAHDDPAERQRHQADELAADERGGRAVEGVRPGVGGETVAHDGGSNTMILNPTLTES